MERKAKPKSVEWRERIVEIQQILDRRMETVTEKLQIYNLLIRAAYDEGLDDESDKVLGLLEEAMGEIDEEWPFKDAHMLVSGTWQEKIVECNEAGISTTSETREVLRVVRNLGFGVYREDDTNILQVGLQFLAGRSEVMKLGYNATVLPFAFAQPHEVSLTYIRHNTDELLSADLREILAKLVSYNSIVHTYVKNPHSDLYRKKPGAQRRFFASIVEELDATLPDPKDIDQARVQRAVVDRIYVVDPNTGSGVVRLSSSKKSGIELSGRIRGFDMLDLQDDTFPLTSPDDMTDKDAGICIAVELDYINASQRELPSNVVLVPSQRARELVLKLY